LHDALPICWAAGGVLDFPSSPKGLNTSHPFRRTRRPFLNSTVPQHAFGVGVGLALPSSLSGTAARGRQAVPQQAFGVGVGLALPLTTDNPTTLGVAATGASPRSPLRPGRKASRRTRPEI